MELILDSSNIEQIRELNELLPIHGVTTNPTIITSSHRSFDAVVKDLLAILREDQPLFIQVIAQDVEGMVREAQQIAGLRKRNIYVKLPVTPEGFQAIRRCKQLGIGVLATAIYTADQAFLAAMSGADYLAPYVNRMDNYGDGVANVKELLQMLRVHEMKAKVVAASFKNTRQVHELICAGVQAVTVPCAIAYQMLEHPGTAIAVAEFRKAWEEAYGRSTLV